MNCPRDAGYGPVRRAITFAVYECGFVPRSMLEDDYAVGYEKVLGLMRSCRFGIHDLSTGERNTPFGLGLFLGARNFGQAHDRAKVSLLLARSPVRHLKDFSDISALEVRAHEDKPSKAIEYVRNWLSTNSSDENGLLPGGAFIARRYRSFESTVPHRRIGFSAECDLIVQWLRENPSPCAANRREETARIESPLPAAASPRWGEG